MSTGQQKFQEPHKSHSTVIVAHKTLFFTASTRNFTTLNDSPCNAALQDDALSEIRAPQK